MNETVTVGTPLCFLCSALTDSPDHLIGSPKALACEKFASESWTRFRDIPALESPDFHFIQGSVSGVDCAAKVARILETETQNTRTEPYDYLVVGSGLRRVFPAVPRSLRRAEFLEEAKQHAKDVRNAQGGVVIVGGGMFPSSDNTRNVLMADKVAWP